MYQPVDTRITSPGKATMIFSCACCQNIVEVKNVSIEGYQDWMAGEKIQDALPDVPKEEREMFISGTCADCFKKL